MPASPRAPRSTQKLSDERLARKRALDREAQRSSRCKTKNHIALLEAQIAKLTRVQKDGDTRELVREIEGLRRENEGLRGRLRAVGKLVGIGVELEGELRESVGDENVRRGGRRAGKVVVEPVLEEEQVGEVEEQVSPTQSEEVEMEGLPEGLELTYQNPELSPPSLEQPVFNQLVTQRNEEDVTSTISMLFDLSTAGGTHASVFPIESLPTPISVPTSVWQAPVLQESQCNKCQCSKIVNFTNDILGTCAKLHARSNSFQHDRDADIPIRAILHGWQAVTKKYALDPLWATLRHADEMIWSRCRPTERLVVLRLLNLMLRYRQNPTAESLSLIPSYLHPRPSQLLIPHQDIIDYLVWPGLRERFVFSPHRYCASSFTALFWQCFRFTWSYSFRDTYTRNRATRLYQYSGVFVEEMEELRNMCMTEEFLTRWPELRGDVGVAADREREGWVDEKEPEEGKRFENLGEGFGFEVAEELESLGEGLFDSPCFRAM